MAMTTVLVAVAIVLVAMATVCFTTIVVIAWFVKSFFSILFRYFIFVLLVVLYIVECTQRVYQLLSPQHSEVLLAESQ